MEGTGEVGAGVGCGDVQVNRTCRKQHGQDARGTGENGGDECPPHQRGARANFYSVLEAALAKRAMIKTMAAMMAEVGMAHWPRSWMPLKSPMPLGLPSR